MKALILGLGNDLLSDDAVGIHAVRQIRKYVDRQTDIVECNLTGLALLDVLVGYDKAVIIDAIHSGSHTPGTIIEMSVEDLRPMPGMSPHYVGLPEVISIGKRLGFHLPGDILILAVEIPDGLTIGNELSKPVASSLEELLNRVRLYFQDFNKCVTVQNASTS